METQATIKYLQVGKGWMWKLYDNTGSVIAKSDFNTPFATEAEAMANFEAWQADGGETVEATPAPLPESAPVSPEVTEPVEPEATAPVEPTPAPETAPVEATPEAPVETTETTGTETAPAETPSDAGTVEPAPVEGAELNTQA